MKPIKLKKLISAKKKKQLQVIESYINGFQLSQHNYDWFIIENELHLFGRNKA